MPLSYVSEETGEAQTAIIVAIVNSHHRRTDAMTAPPLWTPTKSPSHSK